MEITILGTGHGTATECYNTCFALKFDDEYFLVDAGGGNGIIKQLKDSSIPLEKINSMFISHTHTDHIMGAIWILRVVGRKYLVENYNKPFFVYGNNEVINALRLMSKAVLPQKFNNLLDDKIKLYEVDTGTTVDVLNRKINFFDINAKKVKQTGFYFYINDKKEKFTFIGDEVCSENTEKYVKDSEWLFADAYMAGKEAEEYDPIKRHSHSTVKFVSSLCERLNVKNVILSHTIDTDLEHRKEKFTEDAKKYFNGNVYVPDDLEKIEIL